MRFRPPNLKNPWHAHYGSWIICKGVDLGNDRIDFLVCRQTCTNDGFPNVFHCHRR